VRARVLEATVDALAADGFGGLQMESVAAAAGVNKTTLYRRWRTRSALVADALLEVSASEVPIPDTGRLTDDLLALARSVRRAITSRRGRAIVGALAASQDVPDLRQVARRFWRTRYDANAAIITRAIQRGELATEPDPRRVVAALAGPIYFRAFVTRERLDDDFLRTIVHNVVTGLRMEGDRS